MIDVETTADDWPYRRKTNSLQWGHVLIDVETEMSLDMPTHGGEVLQWGHVLIDVETARSS